MNILEAKNLAEQGKTVIAPNGIEFTIADIMAMQPDSPVRFDYVFGEWTVKREPRRVWVNVYCGMLSDVACGSLDEAIDRARHYRETTVEFIEVME